MNEGHKGDGAGEASRLTRRDRLKRAISAVVLASGLSLGLGMAARGIAWLSCPFHDLTGHSCLTCGMTRSLAALGHGDFVSALQHHLFGPVLVAGIVLWSVFLLIEAVMGRRVLSLPGNGGWRAVVIAFGGLWLIYGIARVAIEVLV